MGVARPLRHGDDNRYKPSRTAPKWPDAASRRQAVWADHGFDRDRFDAAPGGSSRTFGREWRWKVDRRLDHLGARRAIDRFDDMARSSICPDGACPCAVRWNRA